MAHFNPIAAILKGLISIWPFLLIPIGVICVQLILRMLEKQKLSRLGISDIDKLDGKSFEKYLEILFNRKGYSVKRTKYIGDYGADLVVESDGKKRVIQAKRWRGKVGVKAIQEVVASKGYYDCNEAMVVTNSHFTDQAKILARANNVELWDRKHLIAELSTINPENTTHSDSESKCLLCGKPVSEKVKEYCLSQPNRFKGKIYCYTCQKQAAN